MRNGYSWIAKPPKFRVLGDTAAGKRSFASARSGRTVVRAAMAAAPLFLPLAAPAEPPASVRSAISNIVVEEDGTAVQTMEVKLALNNDAAARREGQQALPYTEGLERVELVEGYTLKADGRRLPVLPDAIRTQLMPGIPSLPAYSDRKQVIAPFPE